MSLCKDTNFKANHNAYAESLINAPDVCLCAKIRILKQITTVKAESLHTVKMFVFVQRYEF